MMQQLQLGRPARLACERLAALPARPVAPRARGTSAPWHLAASSDRQTAPELRDRSSAPELADEEPSTSGREQADAGQPVRFPAKWLALFASSGVAETGYLLYSKLLGGPVACPASGSCDSVLNSDYSRVFGLPLSLLGVLGYAAVAGLAGSALLGKLEPGGLQKTATLAGASALATCSSYLVYILVTQFPGDVCVWCLGSAATSAAILVTALRGLNVRDLKAAALPSCAAALAVVLLLSAAWADASGPGADAELDIPFQEARITAQSSPQAVQLARKLKAAGAKMYGAFWCSHCQEQKAEFGAAAQKDLPYVECYPQGYHKGTKINPACAAAGLEGFPSWVINGKTHAGEKTFEQLEELLVRS